MLMNIDFVHLHFTSTWRAYDYQVSFKNCFFVFQRGCDSYMVYLFDKSKTVYEGPFASRSLSDCVNYIGKSSPFTD